MRTLGMRVTSFRRRLRYIDTSSDLDGARVRKAKSRNTRGGHHERRHQDALRASARMNRRVIHTDKVPPARVPLSQAIAAGEWIFVSGQLGLDPSTGRLVPGGIAAETRQVC